MKKSGLTSRILNAFRTPSARWGAGSLAAIGFLAGIIFWVGFEGFVASTGTEEFCLSCHEMQAGPYAEYEKSAHFGSRSGVRPICSDCHVPKAFFPKMRAKIRATLVEIPGHLMGNIDTPEKFEAKREELATRALNRMRGNDSAGCRSCHDVNAMSAEEQKLRAVREHEAGEAAGDTCVDCHMGIAHTLPDSMQESDEEVDFDF
jgi:cytochrome c-type protein NapC